jgi:hypothetical protein
MGKKEDDRAYYERNRERIKARANAYYHDNKEKVSVAQRQYYEANKDKVLAGNRAWAEANPDARRRHHSEYVKRNRALWSAQTATYRAAKKKSTPSWASPEAIKVFYADARKLKEQTGKEWHVDHIVPLQSELVCGLHVEHNLQLLPGRANRVKSNKNWPEMP